MPSGYCVLRAPAPPAERKPVIRMQALPLFGFVFGL